MRFFLITLLLLCLSCVGYAQNFTDDGCINNTHAKPYPPTALTQGSLTTLFASDNQFGGNMFDITPTTDMQIIAIEVNVDGPAPSVNIDVYYRVGSCVGYENNPLSWTLLSSGIGAVAGQDLPTHIDLSGNGITFSSGQVYGIYVDVTNFTSGLLLRYTNGQPTTFSNSDLSLLTHCGKGFPAFIGLTAPDRQWNGTIYYDTTSGPNLDVSPLVGGQTGTFTFTGGTPNNNSNLAYSTTGPGSTFVPYLNVSLDISQPKQVGPTLLSDPGGTTVWNIPIPPGIGGINIWFQAVQFGLKTNVVPTVIV